MRGELAASAGHQVAHGELGNAFADLDHFAGQAIAQGCPGIEAIHDLAVGGHRTELLEGIDNLFDLLGPRARHAQVGSFRIVNLHLLGTGRDEGVTRTDENPAGLERGRGYVFKRQ